MDKFGSGKVNFKQVVLSKIEVIFHNNETSINQKQIIGHAPNTCIEINEKIDKRKKRTF